MSLPISKLFILLVKTKLNHKPALLLLRHQSLFPFHCLLHQLKVLLLLQYLHIQIIHLLLLLILAHSLHLFQVKLQDQIIQALLIISHLLINQNILFHQHLQVNLFLILIILHNQSQFLMVNLLILVIH
jgi:hypothetical protein